MYTVWEALVILNMTCIQTNGRTLKRLLAVHDMLLDMCSVWVNDQIIMIAGYYDVPRKYESTVQGINVHTAQQNLMESEDGYSIRDDIWTRVKYYILQI